MSQQPLRRYITADGVLWVPVHAGYNGPVAFFQVDDDTEIGQRHWSLNEVLESHGAIDLYDPIVETAKVLVAAAEHTGRELDQSVAEDIVVGLDVLGRKVVKVTEDTPD
ncbi:hypothetical protein OLP41_gp061 [Mycobacterium phage I3]|uniref:Uncharacterized protein n=1 Tax=Mycobacterium phage I3 TaxID=2994057 RepID=A0A8F2IWI7_9CAUD|nr:hypothetical protein OLP41_gp061 [Mycobacterium phage I3]QWT30344.1 hypothetical protein PBI_I3_61 [Mycobacterium phage I3]